MKKHYEAPIVESIDIVIERGFAASPNSDPLENPTDNGFDTGW